MKTITLHFEDDLHGRKEALKNNPTWNKILEEGVASLERKEQSEEKEQSSQKESK